jgi:hypothetical protein
MELVEKSQRVHRNIAGDKISRHELPGRSGILGAVQVLLKRLLWFKFILQIMI